MTMMLAVRCQREEGGHAQAAEGGGRDDHGSGQQSLFTWRLWRTSPPQTEDSLEARARLARLLMSAVVLVTVLVIPPMPSGSFLAVAVVVVGIDLEDPPEAVAHDWPDDTARRRFWRHRTGIPPPLPSSPSTKWQSVIHVHPHSRP